VEEVKEEEELDTQIRPRARDSARSRSGRKRSTQREAAKEFVMPVVPVSLHGWSTAVRLS
jgi:hypothetical protein